MVDKIHAASLRAEKRLARDYKKMVNEEKLEELEEAKMCSDDESLVVRGDKRDKLIICIVKAQESIYKAYLPELTISHLDTTHLFRYICKLDVFIYSQMRDLINDYNKHTKPTEYIANNCYDIIRDFVTIVNIFTQTCDDIEKIDLDSNGRRQLFIDNNFKIMRSTNLYVKTTMTSYFIKKGIWTSWDTIKEGLVK